LSRSKQLLGWLTRPQLSLKACATIVALARHQQNSNKIAECNLRRQDWLSLSVTLYAKTQQLAGRG
jgi:hypothetical protein